MASEAVDPARLIEGAWKELRTELHEWDDCGGEVVGFDCLTRYWCPEAVFEIYWIAEKSDGTHYDVYLTEDLEIAGFRSALSYQPSMSWKRELAEKLNWQDRAMKVIRELSGTQLNLFED